MIEKVLNLSYVDSMKACTMLLLDLVRTVTDEMGEWWTFHVFPGEIIV